MCWSGGNASSDSRCSGSSVRVGVLQAGAAMLCKSTGDRGSGLVFGVGDTCSPGVYHSSLTFPGAFVLLVGVSGLGDGVLGTIGLGWSSSSSELSSSDSEGMGGDGGAFGFSGGRGPSLSVSCSTWWNHSSENFADGTTMSLPLVDSPGNEHSSNITSLEMTSFWRNGS